MIFLALFIAIFVSAFLWLMWANELTHVQRRRIIKMTLMCPPYQRIELSLRVLDVRHRDHLAKVFWLEDPYELYDEEIRDAIKSKSFM